jgi:uncharacterized protein (DUF885 family)
MRALPLALSLSLLACGGARPEAAAPAPAPGDDPAVGVEDAALAELLRDHWEANLRRYPTFATRLGDHRFDDRLTDPSRQAVAAHREVLQGLLARARALDGLSESDALTRDLFVEQLAGGLGTAACRFEDWSISASSNPLTAVNRLPELVEVDTDAEAAALLARYEAFPGVVDATVANLRAGAADGLYANATTVRNVIAMTRAALEAPVADSTLLSPVAAVPEPRGRALRAAVEDGIRPALTRYVDFLETEILPYARPDAAAGVGALPLGVACYAAAIRDHTTTEATARELHELGLREIARLDDAFRELGQRVFETDDLGAILARLRDDPALYFDTEDEVEEAANAALSAARERIPAYFGRLPQAPCVVARIPAYEAAFSTIAYYRPPHPDGSKPGEYFVNTTEPGTRPRFEARVLAYHEAIPGHHLQIAIAQELGAIPAFRRHHYVTAYVEGWALYTERLADEMGLYETDLDRFGVLSFDAWRAARLVVDTGVHALGWSREEAEAFMAAHTALAPNNIRNEVDRYLAWPGQALAYKVGQLAILRLRADAEARLGERFALPAFHDVVLEAGPLPLGVLEARVERWIAGGGG